MLYSGDKKRVKPMLYELPIRKRITTSRKMRRASLASSPVVRSNCYHCGEEHPREKNTLCVPCAEIWSHIGKPVNAKQCSNCGTADTRKWRKGPQGSETLCNACGQRWTKRGTLEYKDRRRVPKKTAHRSAPNTRGPLNQLQENIGI